jgi:hypothetical protein
LGVFLLKGNIMAAGTDLTGKSGTNIYLTYKGAVEIATPTAIINRYSPTTWTFGNTLAADIDVVFQDQRATDNTGETLDLYASGALLDCFGNPLTMEAIKMLYIKNTHATTILRIFGNGANDLLILTGTTDAIDIHPGGEFYWSSPSVAGIVTTTNKNLFIQASTVAAVTYDIIAAGLDD